VDRRERFGARLYVVETGFRGIHSPEIFPPEIDSIVPGVRYQVSGFS